MTVWMHTLHSSMDRVQTFTDHHTVAVTSNTIQKMHSFQLKLEDMK